MTNRTEGATTDAPRSNGPTRRDALGRGLIAIAGIALAGVSARQARAQQPKLAQSAVQYVERYAVEGKDCDDCMHYIDGPTRNAPGTCKIVEGAISPHGHCIAFVPKPPR